MHFEVSGPTIAASSRALVATPRRLDAVGRILGLSNKWTDSMDRFKTIRVSQSLAGGGFFY
jgi:hypothetical protein